MTCCLLVLTKRICRTITISTEWFTFSFMITVLSECGKTRTRILRSYPDIELFSLRISVCIWRWLL